MNCFLFALGSVRLINIVIINIIIILYTHTHSHTPVILGTMRMDLTQHAFKLAVCFCEQTSCLPLWMGAKFRYKSALWYRSVATGLLAIAQWGSKHCGEFKR
jgi:hypothetical protein